MPLSVSLGTIWRTVSNAVSPTSTPAPSTRDDWFELRPAGSTSAPQGTTTGGLSPIAVRTWTPPPPFPPSAGLGVNTIHRYTEPRVTPPVIAVTVHTPVPTQTVPGTVLDTNSKPYDEPLRARFIIGDGGTTRAFTGVDLTVGSPLDRKLDAIVARMPKQADGSVSKADALEFLRVETNKIIRWTAGSSANDGRAEFAWDKALSIGSAARAAFQRVAFQDVGAAVEDTGEAITVVGLEQYIEAGEGYCIQKALLAACVLGKLGIPFRLVNGAVAQSPGRTVGHTWLELDDGHVLDVAWGKLGPKSYDHDVHSDWFRFGSSHRFANQRYPFLALTQSG